MNLLALVILGGTIHNGDGREYRLLINDQKNVRIEPSGSLDKVCETWPCRVRNMDSEQDVVLEDREENVEIKDGAFAPEGGGGGGAPSAPAPAAKPSGKKHR